MLVESYGEGLRLFFVVEFFCAYSLRYAKITLLTRSCQEANIRVTMAFTFETAILAVVMVWLIALTFLFWQIFSHYSRLTKGVSSKTLKTILEDVLKEVGGVKKDIDILKARCDTIEQTGFLHIQKIGLLRFNPFKDTGGDQSFILALLDGNDTGVVISGLYSRSGTRWYAKKVRQGKGLEHELSEEEKKALTQAKATSDIERALP